MFSLLIGALSAPASYWAIRILKRSGVDDRLECLGAHGLAGFLGIVFTGLFAQKSEDSPADGFFFGNPMQLGIQLAGVGVTLVLCIVGTTLSYWIVWAAAYICRLEIRVGTHEEGSIDEVQHREKAYIQIHDSAAPDVVIEGVCKNARTDKDDLSCALLDGIVLPFDGERVTERLSTTASANFL